MPSLRSRFAVPSLALALTVPAVGQTMSPPVKAAFDQAYAQLQKGHVAPAIAKYEEALKIAPNSRDVLLEYVVALRKGCRFQQSAKAGWRLLEVDPAYVPSWGNLGNTFLAAGEWDAAFLVFDKAAGLTKDKAWGAQNLLNLGHAQCTAGDAKGGLKAFQRAAKIDPKNGLTMVDTAAAQALLGDKAQAIAGLKAAIVQLSKQSDARSKATRAYAELMQGALEQGRPPFPDERSTYVQVLPAAFARQPEKGKAAALEPTAEVEHLLRADDKQFVLRAPEAWTLVVDGKGSQETSKTPMTLTFAPPAPARVEMLVTLFGKAVAKEKAKAFIDRLGHVQLATAVEKDVEVKELTAPNAWGYWFRLQDKSLAGREPQEGEYRFATQGLLVVGESMFNFTMLTDDDDEKTMAPLFTVLQGLAVRASGP